jgi:MoxR-like ATPase
LTERLRKLRDTLSTGLVERDMAIRLALLAVLSGEHLLLIGPPGTAKSLVARRLRAAFQGGAYFERLLTRFTVPEELFGPLSIKALEDDRYERLTARYLPQASVAFLDEIFKANSAILNALLTLLNEREFDNGTRREPSPLLAVVAASNELLEGEELSALYDRFLLRLYVAPVSKEKFSTLLQIQDSEPSFVSKEIYLTPQDLQDIQKASEKVSLPSYITDVLSDLRDWCETKSIYVSDRRWRKVVKLLKMSALTNGFDEVSILDLWLLQHCLWEKESQRQEIYDWYINKIGANPIIIPENIIKLIKIYQRQFEVDKNKRSQSMDQEGNLLYLDENGKKTKNSQKKKNMCKNGKNLYLAPPNSIDRNHRVILDRSNGGQGYTIEELNTLFISHKNHLGRSQIIHLQHWSEFSTYLKSDDNLLFEIINLHPILEIFKYEKEYINQKQNKILELKLKIENIYKYFCDTKIKIKKIIESHLWIQSSFLKIALKNISDYCKEIEIIIESVDLLLKNYKSLPVVKK